MLIGGEPLAYRREAAERTSERVVAADAIAEGLVLHAAPALIERGHLADPVRVIDQLLTDRDHGVHHRTPPATKIGGDLAHRATVTADLARHPPGRA